LKTWPTLLYDTKLHMPVLVLVALLGRTNRQGNRILLGQDGHEILFAPTGTQALALDALFDRLFPAEQVERQMTKHHKVFLSVAQPQATRVFI